MKFSLVYTRRAIRDIEALDALARKRLGRQIQALEEDPVGKSKKLLNSKLGTYRFRIGDYRVIFDVHGSQVIILRVGHRREIYR